MGFSLFLLHLFYCWFGLLWFSIDFRNWFYSIQFGIGIGVVVVVLIHDLHFCCCCCFFFVFFFFFNVMKSTLIRHPCINGWARALTYTQHFTTSTATIKCVQCFYLFFFISFSSSFVFVFHIAKKNKSFFGCPPSMSVVSTNGKAGTYANAIPEWSRIAHAITSNDNSSSDSIICAHQFEFLQLCCCCVSVCVCENSNQMQMQKCKSHPHVCLFFFRFLYYV